MRRHPAWLWTCGFGASPTKVLVNLPLIHVKKKCKKTHQHGGHPKSRSNGFGNGVRGVPVLRYNDIDPTDEYSHPLEPFSFKQVHFETVN